MIDRQEILDFAREFSLAPNVVEKDYVLGWMLAGISAHPALGDTWIFKGGTCLKKCYFETYRFSEDLDFTLTDAAHLNERFLRDTFTEVAEWVMDQAGIEIPEDTIRFEIFNNPRGNPSGQGRVGYRGPLARRGDAPRIKLDITPDEILVLEPVVREVNHPYSDRPESGINVRCYAFEEVFAEKVRALAERERPRDLYDVVHLHRHDELQPDRNLIFATLQRKCEFKGIAVPTYEQLADSPNRPELEAEWENMLSHQLPVLPLFEAFWEALPEVFGWLHGTAEKPVRPVATVSGQQIDSAWQPPAMGRAWNVAIPLEAVRFAAANRLCVAMRYQRKDGAIKDYLVEPYSMRMSQQGNLLLYAVKHDTGDIRAFIVDQILNVEVTKTSFIPRYQIELTPAGPVSAPPVNPNQLPRLDAHPKPTQRKQASRAGNGRSRGGLSTSGPKHVFECPACGKKFTRKTYDSTLNPHKNKDGWPCYGRWGTFVETKY